MTDLQSWLYPKPSTFMLNTVRSVLTQPFAFDLLLQQFSKEKKNIVLVLLSQNWSHYSAVATKCGLNLKNHQSDGMISAVDVFEYNTPLNGFDYSFDWAMFVQDINAKVASLPDHSILLIDDLSVLLSLNIDPSSVYTFVRQLRKELLKKQSTLFIASFYLQEDEQLYNLITSLVYECDTWLDCDKPKSGYSLHINGIAKCLNKTDRSSIEMNYKLSNRNVVFKKL